MAKLQLLNAYLTERLMVAVDEILEVVGGTVSEFEEETARTKRENEVLKRRLREVGLDTGTECSAGDDSNGSLSIVCTHLRPSESQMTSVAHTVFICQLFH